MDEKHALAALFRNLQVRFSRFYARILTAADLTLPQYALLSQLANEGTTSMTLASRKLHISKPAVTNLVDRLEKKRLLKRLAHPGDRRVTLLEIQPRGEVIVRAIQRRIIQLMLKALAPLKSAERNIVRRFYDRLAQTLEGKD